MSDEGQRILDAKIAVYIEERRKLFVRGFARFVIGQGVGALCSVMDPKTKKPITWQTRGRQLYGAELFTTVMREELEKLKGSSGGA